TLSRSACRRRTARVIGVVGARGGVGASVLASALARAGARARVGVALVDLDRSGPGVDLMRGLERGGGLSWAGLDGQGGGVAGQALAEALPIWHGVHVLSCDWRGEAEHGIAPAAVDALASGHDLVVLDLPRTEPSWAGYCDAVLIVTTCAAICAEAVRTTATVWTGAQQTRVARRPARGGVTPEEIATASGVPLVLAMRPERGMAAGAERGLTPGDNRRGALRRGAGTLIKRLDLAS